MRHRHMVGILASVYAGAARRHRRIVRETGGSLYYSEALAWVHEGYARGKLDDMIRGVIRIFGTDCVCCIVRDDGSPCDECHAEGVADARRESANAYGADEAEWTGVRFLDREDGRE